MARLNAYGNTLVTVDDTTGVGLYAADGSMRVTVVDGTTVTGLYAADGSINVVAVEATATPVCRYHECGALRGVAVSEPTVGFVAPNGALYMTGLSGTPTFPASNNLIWATGNNLTWGSGNNITWGNS